MSLDATPAKIERVEVAAYTVPTDAPEADGTLEWNATTLVLATLSAQGATGIGYTYANAAAGALIADPLRDCVVGQNVLDTGLLWRRMNRALRNVGRPGAGLMAISALDHAAWDLKAHILGLSVADLLGRVREAVPAYGSGGFTSYPVDRLQAQLGGWASQGFAAVKMKVGTHPAEDPARVHVAREAIGDGVDLMTDANGAYSVRQALALAARYADDGVTWLEEPVSSDDLEGLALVRAHGPSGIAVAAGEYGWDAWYFRRMLAAGAVDVLQIDSTRCGGFTGFLECAAVARAFGVPLSAHCAPALHAQVCSAIRGLAHVEYFHDHARIEGMLFDGVPDLRDGLLHVSRERPGLGLSLRRDEAKRYRTGSW